MPSSPSNTSWDEFEGGQMRRKSTEGHQVKTNTSIRRQRSTGTINNSLRMTSVNTKTQFPDDDNEKSQHKSLSEDTAAKRKAQNRSAQQAFRARKQDKLNELETRIQELETEKIHQELEQARLNALLHMLERENEALKSGKAVDMFDMNVLSSAASTSGSVSSGALSNLRQPSVSEDSQGPSTPEELVTPSSNYALELTNPFAFLNRAQSSRSTPELFHPEDVDPKGPLPTLRDIVFPAKLQSPTDDLAAFQSPQLRLRSVSVGPTTPQDELDFDQFMTTLWPHAPKYDNLLPDLLDLQSDADALFPLEPIQVQTQRNDALLTPSLYENVLASKLREPTEKSVPPTSPSKPVKTQRELIREMIAAPEKIKHCPHVWSKIVSLRLEASKYGPVPPENMLGFHTVQFQVFLDFLNQLFEPEQPLTDLDAFCEEMKARCTVAYAEGSLKPLEPGRNPCPPSHNH